jgi:hypothetical protein
MLTASRHPLAIVGVIEAIGGAHNPCRPIFDERANVPQNLICHL